MKWFRFHSAFPFLLRARLFASPNAIEFSFRVFMELQAVYFRSVSKPWLVFGSERENERTFSTFDFVFFREINYGAARREHEKQPASSLFGQLRNEMFNIDKNARSCGFWYRKGLWLAPINHADERWVSQWVIAFNDQEKKHEQRRAKKERLEAKIYSLFIPCRAFLCSTSSWNVFFSRLHSLKPEKNMF